MGLIQHNAVIAITSLPERFTALLPWIGGLPPEEAMLFHVGESWVNGYRTVALFPDGSKEGWAESDKGDALREKFIARLREDDYADGSLWEFVELSFGECGAVVTSTNCEDVMNR